MIPFKNAWSRSGWEKRNLDEIYASALKDTGWGKPNREKRNLDENYASEKKGIVDKILRTL